MAGSSSSTSRGSIDSEEPLDPRVKVELDTLNQCASDVNRLEREIEEARGKYQQNFSACSQELERLKKKLGTSIKKARLYYELKEKAREAQNEALRSTRKFQSANGVYRAAKETISLAELRLMDDKAANLSAAWQEMLNHALFRVTEAEREKAATEKEHLERAAAFAEIEQQLVVQEKRQKKSIEKSRLYFDTKKELEIKLQQVKQTIQDLQQAMVSAKGRYSTALRRLETISNCIHEKRKEQLVLMFPREPGVGAEENQWTEQKLPTLSTCDADDSDDYDDDYDDVDDDDYNGVDSDSVFRAKVLTTSLDEQDTTIVKSHRGKKKQLKRSQSLPLNPSQLARRQRGDQILTPLADRAEVCPPDGQSVSSGTSLGAGSVSSVSSQDQLEVLTQLSESKQMAKVDEMSTLVTASLESSNLEASLSEMVDPESLNHESLATFTPDSQSFKPCPQTSETQTVDVKFHELEISNSQSSSPVGLSSHSNSPGNVDSPQFEFEQSKCENSHSLISEPKDTNCVDHVGLQGHSDSLVPEA